MDDASATSSEMPNSSWSSAYTTYILHLILGETGLQIYWLDHVILLSLCPQQVHLRDHMAQVKTMLREKAQIS